MEHGELFGVKMFEKQINIYFIFLLSELYLSAPNHMFLLWQIGDTEGCPYDETNEILYFNDSYSRNKIRCIVSLSFLLKVPLYPRNNLILITRGTFYPTPLPVSPGSVEVLLIERGRIFELIFVY